MPDRRLTPRHTNIGTGEPCDCGIRAPMCPVHHAPENKRCRGRCGLVKQLKLFRRNATKTDGHADICAACAREQENARK